MGIDGVVLFRSNSQLSTCLGESATVYEVSPCSPVLQFARFMETEVN